LHSQLRRQRQMCIRDSVSIPRDSFVEIVGADYEDKINHAHSIGGPEMIMDTVEKFLDIPIHHYVSVNMDGLQTLVDAVGGVTVDNDFAFSAEGIDYQKGCLLYTSDAADE
ncbi:LCP family protein, partial [Enterococcus sp. S181_ASV_20]|nr:LCP family protein [Enterococcus sp. S181_ASV_20]